VTDLRDDLGRMVNAIGKISSLRELSDMVDRAREATVPKCGRCSHWMKSRICPREKNVNGISKGPSCNALPCDKFQWDEFHKTLIVKQRVDRALSFARKHDLPVPEHLAQLGEQPA